MFGRARVLKTVDVPKVEEELHRKFPQLNEVGGIPAHHVIVEVTPEKIYFMDFTKELGHKSVFFPKDTGQGFLSKVNW